MAREYLKVVVADCSKRDVSILFATDTNKSDFKEANTRKFIDRFLKIAIVPESERRLPNGLEIYEGLGTLEFRVPMLKVEQALRSVKESRSGTIDSR